MNFFQHQDQARKNTKKLVFLFGIAVAAICTGIYFVFAAVMSTKEPGMSLWQPDTFLTVCVGVILFVGLTSLMKMSSLSGGGSKVCEMMGGRLVSAAAKDANERRLLNLVEEMSIASGVPVPSVFVIDDESINAFAAGHSQDNAAIAVTTGCMNLLNRDELQGVIGHEFSHILNGDMRINIRLIGILHGILFIGLAGTWAMRMAAYSNMGRSRRSEGGQAALAMFVIGFLLMILGFVGVFFGNIIKAGLSRQREFLADASAVQFTRNRDGISGALKKIHAHVNGSTVSHPKASEISHMYFANGLKSNFSGIFATHPPLEDRISRLEGAQFDGRVEPQHLTDSGAPSTTPAAVAGLASGFSAASSISIDAESVAEHVGDPSPEHVDYAATLITNVPADLQQAAHFPLDAVALVYIVLLDPVPSVKNHQLECLEKEASQPVFDAVKRLERHSKDLDPRARLPLLEMAFPTLRQMTQGQYKEMMRVIEAMIRADGKLSLFEFALHKIIKKRLAATFERGHKERVRYKNIRSLSEDIATVLAGLAFVGHPEKSVAQGAFSQGLKSFKPEEQSLIGFKEREACTFGALSAALDRLAEASPSIKKQVIDACAHCALADAEVTLEEAELLRAFADSMGCPIPPFLPKVA
jgi:Zn-dependent protease with chaperone function